MGGKEKHESNNDNTMRRKLKKEKLILSDKTLQLRNRIRFFSWTSRKQTNKKSITGNQKCGRHKGRIGS